MDIGKALAKMVYGIICFATLFSFVGTVLGGIWADQSWGRFWGWDPKENGALIIVLWNALILHVRWGGMVRERGLVNLAVFGNIVTSFSWFGVNMLGIGLHSYGFMDGAFKWLTAFVASQLFIIGLGLVPLRLWRSFRGVVTGKSRDDQAGKPLPGSGKPEAASAPA
jgi:cytochrome c biogenesis factor